ncbi:MAG: hypothetical protein C4332_12985 [Meiothermus sp.]
MMFYYVEAGIKGTDAYGDIESSFYNSLESVFEELLKKIADGHDLEAYLTRLQGIVGKTRDFGWGFYDTLEWMLEEFRQKIT